VPEDREPREPDEAEQAGEQIPGDALELVEVDFSPLISTRQLHPPKSGRVSQMTVQGMQNIELSSSDDTDDSVKKVVDEFFTS
jgi:hypothetical protein